MASALTTIKSIQSGHYTEAPGRVTPTTKLAYAINRLKMAGSVQWVADQVQAYGLGVHQARVVAYLAYMCEARGEFAASHDGSDRDLANAFQALRQRGLLERRGETPFVRYGWIG